MLEITSEDNSMQKIREQVATGVWFYQRIICTVRKNEVFIPTDQPLLQF